MKKSTVIVAGCLLTALVGLLVFMTAADFASANVADEDENNNKPAATRAMTRQLSKISRKLDYIENRARADDIAQLAGALSAPDAALEAALTEPPWLPSAPLKGRVVFEQKKCTQCHAVSGAGGSTGPDLAKTFFQGSFLDLASMLWNHIPDMLVEYKAQKITRPIYTEEEVGDLISYLYYLRYLGNPGDISRGEELLEQKNCVKCHLAESTRNDLGPEFNRIKMYASPLELAQALWNHEPKMVEMMHRLNIARPTFTGQEISDLSAFVRAASRSAHTERIYVSPGNPQDGAKVYLQKGCATCHSAGLETAPLIANLPLHRSAADIAGMMWNHGEQMFEKMKAGAIAWPIFEGKEMADLIAYLYFVKFIEPPGNAVVGKTFFQEKKCATCHSIQGVGGTVGPDLALSNAHMTNIGILTAMLNHSETMSEAVLVKGDSWPLLNGREMRDTFAYIKVVSGIRRAAVESAVRAQSTERPLVNGSLQLGPAPTLPVPTRPAPGAAPSGTRPPTNLSQPVFDSEPVRASHLPAIPEGYQIVDALLETALGTDLIQKLKNTLGEEQMENIALSFHHSPGFISKAEFTWTPRNLNGIEQIRIFVPTMSQAELTVSLDGQSVWSPTQRNGRDILSPQIDLDSKEPKLRITVADRGDKGGINGGVDEVYVLRPTTQLSGESSK